MSVAARGEVRVERCGESLNDAPNLDASHPRACDERAASNRCLARAHAARDAHDAALLEYSMCREHAASQRHAAYLKFSALAQLLAQL